MVEPGTAEHELLEPVDERLPAHERYSLPVAHEIAAEPAARLVDPVPLDELDEIGGLIFVQLVVADQPQLHRCGRDTLLEVGRVEAEPVSQKLDDVVVSGQVVGLRHRPNIAPR